MLELMVAIIIIACGIYAFTQAISISLRAYRYADNYLQAVFLLENNLANIELTQETAPSADIMLNRINYHLEQNLSTGVDQRLSVDKTTICWQEGSQQKKIALTAKLLNKR